MAKQVTLAVLGAGARGNTYSRYAKAAPDKLKIVAVAEPDDYRRTTFGDLYGIPESMRFRGWEDFVKQPKLCDAVAICTQDAMHEAPAVACAALGYDILLEKPMAPTADACRRIVAAVKKAGVKFAVGHVLRYTKYTQVLRHIIASGEIGEVVNIQHLEPVGYWHQAHSFVRGNWRNEAESSFMLLAKSCHDIDWLRYVMDKPCAQIQSFGSLRHFKASEAPAGASDRCATCPKVIEGNCPYSAYKIYFHDRLNRGHKGWPTDVLVPSVTREAVDEALRNGPYGRCVYACDNDVVDNQVVNIQFVDGTTASFTMTAFSAHGGRKTRVFGTRGQIETDSRMFEIFHFADDSKRVVDSENANDGGILSGHGGGDQGLIESFVKAISDDDPSYILSGIDDTLESHLMVFAAEESRRTGTVRKVTLD